MPAGPPPARPGGPRTPPPRHSTWTGGRVVSVVIGSFLLFLSTGLLVGGGALAWADQTQREDGFVWTSATELDSDRYAITSEGIELDTAGAPWVLDDFLGTARLEATPADRGTELFVGVARTRDVPPISAGSATTG